MEQATGAQGDGRQSVAVCAITLHRPVGLAKLLEGLSRLHLPSDTVVTAVIVDNDVDGSASTVVDGWRSRLPFPVLYEVEPRRGIPFARNRAIEVAGEVDFVVFIDDDEVPDPDWLDELVAMQRRTGAPVVTGPVMPDFAVPPPRWVVDGGFFDRTRFPDGASVSWATTSSVLIATRILSPEVPTFNEAMALTGGTDTHFFERCRLRGDEMVWADRAVVTETIPETRVSVKWLLQREYRRGNTLTLCLIDLRDSRLGRARRAVSGVGRIVLGVLAMFPAIVRGRAQLVGALRTIAFGVGLLSGLTGRRYEEYRVLHGA